MVEFASVAGAGVALVTNAIKVLDGPVRDKLGKRPDQVAFKKAVGAALTALHQDEPELAMSLVDETFIREHAADLINQYLIGTPADVIARELAARWRDQFHPKNAAADRGLEAVAGAFEQFLTNLTLNLSGFKAGYEVIQLRAANEAVHHLRHIAAGPATVRQDLNARAEYLGWLESRNTYIDARGTLQTQRQVQLKLDEVFVHLSASAELVIDADKYRYQNKDRRDSGLKGEVDLETAVRDNQVVAILGDPGGGKSTLVRYLALTGARALKQPTTDVGDTGEPFLPVLIRVAGLVEQDGWKTDPLLLTIVKTHESAECPSSGLLALFEEQLVAGTCLMMFDGLDEVPEADDRRATVRKIENFISRYAVNGNRFVVTSRIAGYREAALGGTVRHYVIRDMDRTQQSDFLSKWCRAVEDAETPDVPPAERQRVATREIEAITGAIAANRGVAALAVNPLLLRILALIHRTGARLPDKRVELYRLASNTLAQTWRVAQGVPETALVDEQVLTRVLSRLAYWMHTNQPSGSAHYEDVFKVLAEEWCRINNVPWDAENPNAQTLQEVSAFLERVRVQTGLFVERSPGRYGFMHLTFEEYYSARQLIRTRSGAGRAFRLHLHDPRWKEPILLGLGFLGLEFPDDASELMRTAVLGEPEDAGDQEEQGFGASRWEEFLHRDLMFSLECIADGIPVEGRLAARIIGSSVALLLDRHNGWSDLRSHVGRQLARIDGNTSLPWRPLSDIRRYIDEGGERGMIALERLNFLFHTDEMAIIAGEIVRDGGRDPEYRVAAMRVLSSQHYYQNEVPAEAADAVIQVLREENGHLRGAALAAIGNISVPGDMSDVARRVLAHLEPEDPLRPHALDALVRQNWDESAPQAVEALMRIAEPSDHPSEDAARAMTALARAKMGRETARAVLRLMIDAAIISEARDDTIDAMFALCLLHERNALCLPRLDQVATEAELSQLVGSFMLRGRRADGTAETESVLESILAADGDATTSVYMTILTYSWSPEHWLNAAFDRWTAFGPLGRRTLARVASAHELSYTQWLTLADDADPTIRECAAYAVSRVRDRAMIAVDHLAALFADTESAVRAAVVGSIDLRVWPQFAPGVGQALADDDGSVRSRAWGQLEHLDVRVPILERALARACSSEGSISERHAALVAIYDCEIRLSAAMTATLASGDDSFSPSDGSTLREGAMRAETVAYRRRLLGLEFAPVYEMIRASLRSDPEASYVLDDALGVCAGLDPDPVSAVRELIAIAFEHESTYRYFAGSVLDGVVDLANGHQHLRPQIMEVFEEHARDVMLHGVDAKREGALEALEALSLLLTE